MLGSLLGMGDGGRGKGPTRYPMDERLPHYGAPMVNDYYQPNRGIAGPQPLNFGDQNEAKPRPMLNMGGGY